MEVETAAPSPKKMKTEPSPKKMKTEDDEEQNLVSQRERGDGEIYSLLDISYIFGLNKSLKEGEDSGSKSDSDPWFSSPPGTDPAMFELGLDLGSPLKLAPGDGLSSEADVDLGEGSVEDSDYPPSDYDQEYEEYLQANEVAKRNLPAHLQEIIDLPRDQVPKKYLGLRKRHMPLRTRDEEAFYWHVLVKSDGFEIPCFPDRGPNFGEHCPYSYQFVHGSNSKELEGYCNQAIADYNEKEGTNFELKYLIKMCGNMGEYNITFALSDRNHNSHVGRVTVDIPYCPNPEPIIHAMRVTKGEYRVLEWKDAKKKVYKCDVNEEYRVKLPELEKRWKQKMNLE